jgi:hypothetical protein
MPPTLPCPNPACTQVFPPEALKGATSLRCPRCGTVFQFGSAGAAALRSRPTVARPQSGRLTPAPPTSSRRAAPPPLPTVPEAPPQALPLDTIPVAPPVAAAAESSGPTLDTAPALIAPPSGRRPRRRGSFGKVVVLLLLGGIGIGLAVWGGMWLRYLEHHGSSEQVVANAGGRYNFTFRLPGPPWKTDDRLGRLFHVNFALSCETPSNHLGLFLRDYESRMPSEAEQVEQAVAKLRAFLEKGSLEWERKPKNDGARLGGQVAIVVDFAGIDPDKVPVAGECYAAAFRGYAYWFFTWGPEDNRAALAGEWESLRLGFRLLNGREGWKEKPRETDILIGKKADYRLTFPTDLWKRKNAEAFDPAADAVLEAYDRENDPTAKRHAGNAAHFLVLVLPHAADLKAAVAAARAHLDRHLKDQGYEKPLITEVKEKGNRVADGDTDLGTIPGHLSKLQATVEDSASYNRFLILGVAARPEGVLVLLGDCDWNRRDYWEQEFLPLLNTLHTR